MSPGGEDWEVLLARLVTGERAAFLRFQRLVTSFLLELRAFDFEQEWDDLRQEVLLAVVANSRAGRLRDSRAFVGYVRIITRNKFFDRLKHKLRAEGEPLAWEEETARASVLAPPEPTPEARRDLRAALATLPEEERSLVEGVYVEGRSYEEMSERSGVPLGTLKRRLRQGLAALRLRLGEGVGGGGSGA
jgi:RNA polymerase sigma-70 factor (ECF subfamily)